MSTVDVYFYINFCKSVIREFWRFRFVALISGFLIAMAFLAVGMFWEETYSSKATIYADQTNIISPLLQGQAAATNVDSQLQVVRDTLLSQRALENVVNEAGFALETDGPAQLEQKIKQLRASVSIRNIGRNYISVSYESADAGQAFKVVSMLVDGFIAASSENKLNESRRAFEFIERQVAAYKDQLQTAEGKLKEFNASNLDGTEAQVLTNIERLKRDLEEVELSLQQSSERVESLNQQVTGEKRYLTQQAKADEYGTRIGDAQQKLDDLMLIYTDSHPDVVAMQEHIEVLRNAATSGQRSSQGSTAISSIENPVYAELRSALANATVEKNTVLTRANSLRSRLKQSQERLSRVVSRNAELAELTRDYNVTKGLYEDLLQRKEKARLSMSLDIEGQGVSYKIQEPPQYPLVPTGLSFPYFVFIGSAIAILFTIGLAIAYVFLDPRIRFSSQVSNSFDAPLLAEIPHLGSSLTNRINRIDVRWFLFWFVVLAVIYCGTVISYVLFT